VPRIAAGAWVSDSARVIGDVVVGKGCYVGHGAVLRGDYGSIRLGPGTAIEENATLHIRPEGLLELGDRVTVGHSATVHCSHVSDFAVIGIAAVLSFDVKVGRWAIVAEGCVVPAGTEIPAEKLVVGVPARIVGDVEQRHKDFWSYGKQLYVDLAARYPTQFERIG
jgi:carbonic anhydrase/acetyltransferase-like protein (isoleucine patch superfamily)